MGIYVSLPPNTDKATIAALKEISTEMRKTLGMASISFLISSSKFRIFGTMHSSPIHADGHGRSGSQLARKEAEAFRRDYTKETQ